MISARSFGRPGGPGRRRLIAALAVILVVGGQALGTPAHAQAAWPDTIGPQLRALLERLGPDDETGVLIVLRDQLDTRQIIGRDRADRARNLVSALRRHAEQSQVVARTLLRKRLAQGRLRSYVPLWIRNALSVRASKSTIEELAGQPWVASVEPDLQIAAPPTSAPKAMATGSSPAEPNIGVIGAPLLWSRGISGSGVVVASMDTGVDTSNPDLASSWRGGTNSWYDPTGEHASPADLNGHGTWTTGVIVGRDAGGTAVGVAPDARWIAVKIFNDSGFGTSTAIHQGYQWLLDPDGDPSTDDAPDVINNSWSLSWPGCDLTFEPDLAALVAAGITPVFAAGNYGPTSASSASPANNPDALAVGAVDNGDAIFAPSSRGPTSCSLPVSTIFPTVVAPGVNVHTTDRFNLYTDVSGTSLAAPHVTGALALLLSAFPLLTVAQQRAVIVSSAIDLGPVGADDTYGAGRIDVDRAYQALVGSPPPDTTGPSASAVKAAPSRTNDAAPLGVTANIDDAASGGSTIAAAELWIDAPGPDGSGRPMSGPFGSPQADVGTTLLPADLAALAEGGHTALVHGRDAAGNWGPLSAASFVVDRTGPSITSAYLSAELPGGSGQLTLTATADDPAFSGAAPAAIAAGEWFEGAGGLPGSGHPMAPRDGSFDASVEELIAVLDVTGWSPGTRGVSVRARDAAGNWGPVTNLSLSVPDVIFADGFESGSLAEWTSVRNRDTRVRVSRSAALTGAWGMSARIVSGTSGYVIDGSPNAETRYDASFRVDAHGAVTRGLPIDLFEGRSAGGTILFRIEYRRSAGHVGQVRAAVWTSAGERFTSWMGLAGGAHRLAIDWRIGARFTFRADGHVRHAQGSASSRYRLETVRLGPSGGVRWGMYGSPSFDVFVSTRTRVGP